MQTSTDLTVYEVHETMSKPGSTGVYKLVRKTLEEGLPFEQACPHSHTNTLDAAQCDYFNAPTSLFELFKLSEVA